MTQPVLSTRTWLRMLLRSLLPTALLTVAGCATPGTPARALEPAALRTVPLCLQPGPELQTAVVRIATDAGMHGSGVVVAPGLVLTAAHVLRDAEEIEIGFSLRVHQPARAVATDSVSDLALLETNTGSVRALPLTLNGLEPYEDVWAISFPLAHDIAVTQGRFQREANGKLYTSAWITSGASGGGLVRCVGGRYELAGILRDYIAYVRDGGYVNASQSTSTPASEIAEFLNLHAGSSRHGLRETESSEELLTTRAAAGLSTRGR